MANKKTLQLIWEM